MLNGGGGSPLPEAVGLLQRLRDDDLSTFSGEELGERFVQVRATIRLLEVEGCRTLNAFDQCGPGPAVDDRLAAHQDPNLGR